MPIDFENELNAEQLAAVQAGDGPVLIIAAAGTGKTRTLIYRVAWLVEKNISPERILLVTFTNKAAREMMERGRDLAGPSVGGMWGGTFHHLGNRLLRRHAELLGLRPDYTILDSDDSKSLTRNILTDLNLKDKSFPKPEVLLSLYSYARNTCEPEAEIVADRFANHPVDVEDVLRVFREYQQRKRVMQALDFDDLLVEALRLLKEHESVCSFYQERFQHIMVDEYQDTNVIQAELMDLLAGRHKNLLVVGDDFQSIYGWRGADFRNILEFPQRYPNTQVFKLETNYRSVPQILAIANKCISGNPDQFQKELRAVRDRGMDEPMVVQLRTGDDQARFISDRVSELRRQGVRMRDIAVLYRSHFHSMELQLELTRSRIPYQITSGVRFFEQAHVKDVCALPRLLHNPSDQLSFMRLVMLCPKVGEKTALKAWNALGGRFAGTDPAQREKLLGLIPKGARPVWEKVDEVMRRFAEEQLRNDPGRIISEYTQAWYDEYAVNNFDNYPRRMEDIQELVNYSSRFESLEDFLSDLALVTNLETADSAGEEDASNAIRLSSIHQAKGLEWDHVFVLWLAEGMFPSGRAIEDGEDAEERRLFYVVSTRAKDGLYLLAPQMRRSRDGGVQFYTPSRFITELPTSLARKMTYSGYY